MQTGIITFTNTRKDGQEEQPDRKILTGVTATLDATIPKQSLDCLKKMPSFLKDFIKPTALSTSGISTKPLRERETV